MSHEIPYSDDWARLEMAIDSNVGKRTGDTICLNQAEQAIALSVLSGLERARTSDHLAADSAGEIFDRESWLPSEESESEIREAHRPHRRFLRGIAGLHSLCNGIVESTEVFTPPLHDVQKEAVITTTLHLESQDPFDPNSQGAYHNIAGGGGKSRIIALLADGFKRQEDPTDPNRVLIVASDNAVLEELAGMDGQSGLGQYAPHLNVGRVNATFKEHDKSVIISTRESARRAIESNPEYLESFDLVISDEAHTLAGAKTQEAFADQRRPIVGLTGTEANVKQVLPNELSNYDSYELTRQGKLAPVQHWVAKTNEVIYEEETSGEYTTSELKHLSQLEGRQLIAADIGVAFFKDNRNGVFACNTIAEAIDFANAMNKIQVEMPDGRKRTIKVVPVLGTSEDNKATFDRLNRGEIEAVTIVNIDTGWDVPGASFLVNQRPTTSTTRAGQRRARVARRHFDADGNEVTTQIVDLVDTAAPKRRNLEKPRLTRQVIAATLMRQTIYEPGKVIAKPGTEEERRDFAVTQFPTHLRWALTMAAGVRYDRIEAFGAGVLREKAPDGKLTRIEAARGLGVSLDRLGVIMAVIGAKDSSYLNEGAVKTIEERLMETREPIV